MRTINISTVIGGVADALPTKLSRKLLGGCACLGVLLLSSPSSAAAGFDTEGWSVAGGGSLDGTITDNTFLSWSTSIATPGVYNVGMYINAYSEYGELYGALGFRDGAKSYGTSLKEGYFSGEVSVAVINGFVESILAEANANAPLNGFTGTWSYIPPATGLVGVLVYTPFVITTTPVAIDIKPGSPENTVNLGSQGVTKVAVLGSEDFDATQVDPLTVELADATVRVKGNGQAQTTLQDTNGDGFLDLVLHMETEGFSLTDSDVSATLTGTTFGGEDIEGEDHVRVVP